MGAALAGTSFLTWCATPRLVGTVHFGRRDTVDAHTLIRLYALARHPVMKRPLRRVVDGRRLAGIDGDAWTRMTGAVMPQLDTLRGLFERQAVIVTPSLEGARNVALLPALGPGDEYRVFTDADEAYRWADPVDGPRAHAAVARLLEELATTDDLVLRARAWIATHLRDARIQRCAIALGVSARSLQRHLSAAQTSFRQIVTSERLAAARERLVDGASKIEAVARDVGFSSASQLGAALRRAGLPSPARVRENRD